MSASLDQKLVSGESILSFGAHSSIRDEVPEFGIDREDFDISDERNYIDLNYDEIETFEHFELLLSMLLREGF